MSLATVGWDLGGAHVKLVALDPEGRVVAVSQRACPLWQGLGKLTDAFEGLARELPLRSARTHAMTMTGELVDLFSNRGQGVRALLLAMQDACSAGALLVFAGRHGLLETDEIGEEHLAAIASANWLASGLWLARQIADGLLVDVGSTTTDLIPFAAGKIIARGYTDCERMRYDELVYTGIVRTPLMALANRVPFDGEWNGLINEHFATSADIYRLCGELPEHADQHASADGGSKDIEGSARRLARMLGRDVESAPLECWIGLAEAFRERQLTQIGAAVELQLSRRAWTTPPLVIGAGTGRFLVERLAGRLKLNYADVCEICPAPPGISVFSLADCMPAAAVAHLARHRPWPN